MALILATNLRTRAEDGSPMVVPWGTPLEELSDSDREYVLEHKLVSHVPDSVPTVEEEIEAASEPSFRSEASDDEDLVQVEEATTEAE